MAQGLIYTVNPNGTLERMSPSAPENEDRMQQLVARYPELISDGDGDLLLIQREQSISDGDHGTARWSLDHLFVTRDAVPVLVELKRAVDTRLRREVVGQLLDYAANGTAYWQAGRMAASFAQTALSVGANPDELLANFVGDIDAETFWNQVDSNFKAGRIKLVFVADEIPRELARIVEFLNDQMRADVRAIELRWFTSEQGHVTLSPRVIGETERAATSKRSGISLPAIGLEDWIEQNIGSTDPLRLAGTKAFVQAVEQCGGDVVVNELQRSISAMIDSGTGVKLRPLSLYPERGVLAFALQWLFKKPQFADENIRRNLYDRLSSKVGTLSTSNLTGFPSFEVKLLSDPAMATKFKEWLTELFEVAGMFSEKKF